MRTEFLELTAFETMAFSGDEPDRTNKIKFAIWGPCKEVAGYVNNGGQDTINDAGQQIVRRQLNIAPTLTIRPGFPVRVIVTRDLVLEPYGG